MSKPKRVKLAEMVRNWDPWALLVEIENRAAAVGDGRMVSELLNMYITGSGHSTSGYIPQRVESRASYRYWYTGAPGGLNC